MNIRLTITQRDQPGTAQKPRREEFNVDTLLLGRDAGCDVVLPPMTVSRTHARIIRDGGICYIEDAGSAFGTQVNNEPLPPGEKRRLYNGDLIAIAQFDLEFETIAPSSDLWKGIGLQKPYFRIMNGPNEGTHIELEEGREYIVGRTAGAHIVLNTDLVSRRHAKLRRDLAGTHVEDLGSRNGIRLNRKPILSATLSDGEELEIGGVKMLYVDLNEMKGPPPFLRKNNPPPPPETEALSHTARSGPPPKESAPEKPPEEAPKEAPPPEENPSEESPPEENNEAPELSLEDAQKPEKPPPPPLLQGKQALAFFGIGGAATLTALIFLILVLVGAC